MASQNWVLLGTGSLHAVGDYYLGELAWVKKILDVSATRQEKGRRRRQRAPSSPLPEQVSNSRSLASLGMTRESKQDNDDLSRKERGLSLALRRQQPFPLKSAGLQPDPSLRSGYTDSAFRLRWKEGV